jgi:glycosyltransferase involved in cell wall biosynthesis
MRSKLDLWSAWEVAGLVTSEHYDLVHTHTPRTALIGRIASAIAGVPMVHHVHSPTSRDTTSGWSNWLNATAERLSLTGVSRVICVSESLGRHMLAEGFSQERIAVVPNGVPVPERLRDDALPRGTWTLGTVALFRPRKGIEVLLEALARLRAAGLPVRLHAVGPFETPEYEREVRAKADELGMAGDITWTGFVSDVAAELRRCDLFILPSLFGEGLPMVVLEAMAAGVPVVGTRVEGIPEAIRDGQEGLLAEPSDPEDLAGAIGRIVCGEVDWRLLRENALIRHGERFSDRSMAEGVAAVYRAVVERN